MNSPASEYASSGRQRRQLISNFLQTAAVSAPLASYFLGSQPTAYAQQNNALEVPEAKVTPDLSKGEWLPNEFTNDDSLDLTCGPYHNMPSNAAPLPHVRLNHDADTLYALSDLTLETTLKNDIIAMYGLDTAHNGLGSCNALANFIIIFVLRGSGSSPSNYKLQIEKFCETVPDFDKIKANWSYGPSIYNNQNHIVMKEAIPISTLTKYRPASDVNGIFGLEANLGNAESYATWPTGSALYGDLYLSGQTNVDFFQRGMANPILALTLFGATLGIATFKRFSDRKSRLAKRR